MQSITSLLIRGVSQSFGGHNVLSDIELSLNVNSRVGIVGPNGVGKSTLLGIAAGEIQPDEGKVVLSPASTTVGHLAQERSGLPGETVDMFIRRRTGTATATDRLDRASDALAAAMPGADDEYALALDRYLSLGVGDFESRVGQVLDDVGLTDSMLSQTMNSLSGGQAARVGLAALLLSRFDVYLLDEPTNDLDFDGLALLESFVERANAAIAIVSHDRTFLKRTVTSVFEIDEHTRSGAMFNGGWAAYLKEREAARRHAVEAYEVNQRERSELRVRIQQQKQWTDAGVRRQKKQPIDNDKFVRNWGIETSQNQASKISASQRALERLDVVDKPWESWQLNLVFKSGHRSGDLVASLDGAVFERGQFRLGPVSETIHWGERVAITGNNGSGKTTLLHGLLGRLEPVLGTHRMGSGVVIGEIDQTRNLFSSERMFIDVFADAAGVLVQDARSVLAKFALTATHVERTADSLSPGERTRASLALLMSRGTNCLVFDEPTNHLDINAIEQLEIALDGFTGTVLLITHDREFLKRLRTTRTIAL